MLLSRQLSICNLLGGNGCLQQAIEPFPLEAPPVVAVRVLAQIRLWVSPLDAVIRSEQEGFGVRNRLMQPFHVVRIVLRIERHRQCRELLGQRPVSSESITSVWKRSDSGRPSVENLL